MTNSTEVKRFLKRLGYDVRVRTIRSKTGWMDAWIPYTRMENNQLVYDKPLFSEELRRAALAIIYPTTPPETWRDANAGNVRSNSITMIPSEWEKLIATFQPATQAPTV